MNLFLIPLVKNLSDKSFAAVLESSDVFGVKIKNCGDYGWHSRTHFDQFFVVGHLGSFRSLTSENIGAQLVPSHLAVGHIFKVNTTIGGGDFPLANGLGSDF